MADTQRGVSDLLTLAADNTTGLITPQTLRDIIVSGYNKADDSVASRGPNTFLGTQILKGTVKVRQGVGIDDSKEFWLYHDGSDAYIASQTGDLNLLGGTSSGVNIAGTITRTDGVAEAQASMKSYYDADAKEWVFQTLGTDSPNFRFRSLGGFVYLATQLHIDHADADEALIINYTGAGDAAVEVSGGHFHMSGGRSCLTTEGGFESFGLGTMEDQTAGDDSESVRLGWDADEDAYLLNTKKTGGGSYRDIMLRPTAEGGLRVCADNTVEIRPPAATDVAAIFGVYHSNGNGVLRANTSGYVVKIGPDTPNGVEISASSNYMTVPSGFEVRTDSYSGTINIMNVTAKASAADKVPLTIQLATSQTENALSVKNSVGTTRFYAADDGSITTLYGAGILKLAAASYVELSGSSSIMLATEGTARCRLYGGATPYFRSGANIQHTWTSTSDNLSATEDLGIGRYAAGVFKITDGSTGQGGITCGSLNSETVGLTVNVAGTGAKTVSNKALTSNVATLTTSAAHGFAVGSVVVVTGVDSTFNGTYTILSVPTATTFTYAKTASNVSNTSASGTATVTQNANVVEVASGGAALIAVNGSGRITSAAGGNVDLMAASSYGGVRILSSDGTVRLLYTDGDTSFIINGQMVLGSTVRGHNGSAITIGSGYADSDDNIANLYLRDTAAIGWDGNTTISRNSSGTAGGIFATTTVTGADLLTLQGPASQTGNYLNLKNSVGTSTFRVECIDANRVNLDWQSGYNLHMGENISFRRGGGGADGTSQLNVQEVLVCTNSDIQMKFMVGGGTPIALHSSNCPVAWANATNLGGDYTGDTYLSRVSEGVLKVTNASGVLGDLRLQKLIAQYASGSAGTDEVQVYHDGSNGYVASKDGELRFNSDGYVRINNSGGVSCYSVTGNGVYSLDSGAGGEFWLLNTATMSFRGSGGSVIEASLSAPSGGFVATTTVTGADILTLGQPGSHSGKILNIKNSVGTSITYFTGNDGGLTVTSAGGTGSGSSFGGTDKRGVLTVQKNGFGSFATNTDPQDAGRAFVMQENSSSNTANEFTNVTLQINATGSLTGGRCLADMRLVRETTNQSNCYFIWSGFTQSNSYTDWFKVGRNYANFTGSLTVGGGFTPASMADSAASNGTLYYSTDAGKLVFKDGSGTVNNLY